MKSLEQLPYILDLLEDDSEVIQKQINRELKSLGPDLWYFVNNSGVDLDPAREYKLQKIYTEIFEDKILESWGKLFTVTQNNSNENAQNTNIQNKFSFKNKFNLFKKNTKSNTSRNKKNFVLEEGFSILSDYLISDGNLPSLSFYLDNFEKQIKNSVKKPDLYSLINFLFQQLPLRGNNENYYSPLNSSLVWVLSQKKGNPISLCSLLIIFAERFSIKVEGCNFPGHFMALAKDKNNKDLLIDCFNGGYIFREKDLQKLFSTPYTIAREEALKKADNNDIFIRVLHNLQYIYSMNQDLDKLKFIKKMQQLIP